ncbi:MAG: hypothetical protein QGI32_08435 [Candidatus Latescibacteria bacterium]|jgi:hypothetical protein|nr:hypothetical protein [Candidatus Latescibacterota bacterium]
MRLCTTAVLLAMSIGLWVNVAVYGIDSLVVGNDGNIARRNLRWDILRSSSRRVNVTRDSVWKWSVEAHTNIAPGLFARGGRVTVIGGGEYVRSTDSTLSGGLQPRPIEETSYFGNTVIMPFPAVGLVVDGNAQTAYAPDGVEAERASAIHIDLGEAFGVERVRLHPRLDRDHRNAFPQVFLVSSYGEEGAPLVMTSNDVGRFFTRIPSLAFSPTLRNYTPVVDESFRHRPVRFLRVEVLEDRPWELAEIEIYADGTLPSGWYVSNALTAISDHPIWGRVLHEGRSVAELPIVIQTATGPTADHTLYFRKTGFEGQVARVTARQYDRLETEERGPTVRNPEWSNFEVLRDGVVASPGARRYLQFRLLLSEPGTVLRNLVFQYTAVPLVLLLTGEINPNIVSVGRDTTFTLSLQANTRTEKLRTIDSRGFRRIRVNTTAAVHEVTEVLVRDRPAPHTVNYEPGRGFDVNLGQRISRDATFVQITFEGAVYRDGTRFEVQARDLVLVDGRLDTLYQVAIPTDVEPLTPGGELTVRLTEPSQEVALISHVTAAPAVLTPNGDGVNDVASIGYSLVRVAVPTPTRVTLHGLSGRLVRTLFEGEVTAGRLRHGWDGRDDSGRLVLPGLYVATVEVRAGHRTAVGRTVAAVAY